MPLVSGGVKMFAVHVLLYLDFVVPRASLFPKHMSSFSLYLYSYVEDPG